MTEIFLERKKNGQIQELISNMRLILSYTVQLVIPNVCTTHTLTHKHINRKGKNYIPPIYFVCRGYNKIGISQPRVIIYINFVELASPMLHAKFQDHRTSGSGEEDF